MEIKTEKTLSAESRRKMLEDIMEHFGIESQAAFAKRLGITPQNMSSWFSRGAYNEEVLAVAFPELSGDWLLLGEGPMLKADRTVTVKPSDSDLHRALAAIAEEQRLTARAQSQADKLIAICQTLSAALKKRNAQAEGQ